ncbi:MAG: thioredoxin domain-containing protein [Candidatus Zambryskibacteria bacterium]|nr:thioredoxin domain-containing protein [Candidatus Zambryskibacteria bacterium]
MKKQILIILAVLVVVLGGAFFARKNTAPSIYDTFAQCITDSGAKFYGAFWCPHCRDQKAMFGSSAKLLPYVECSTPDGQSQTPICKEKEVKSYPTWTFTNASSTTGTVELADLATKTGCALPVVTN